MFSETFSFRRRCFPVIAPGSNVGKQHFHNISLCALYIDVDPFTLAFYFVLVQPDIGLYPDFNLKVFLSLSMTVNTKLSYSENIKVASWIPQNDVLGHSKTKLLFGHAGGNGMIESLYHGVPMVCAPFYADQFDNALIAKTVGFAKIIDLDKTTADELVSIILKVLSDQR